MVLDIHSNTADSDLHIFCHGHSGDFAIAPMMWYYLHKIRVATDFSTCVTLFLKALKTSQYDIYSTASLLLGLMQLVVVSGLAIRWRHLGFTYVRPNHLQCMLAARSHFG